MKTRYKIIITISVIFVVWIGVAGIHVCVLANPSPDWLGSHNACGPWLTYEIQNYFGILWYN